MAGLVSIVDIPSPNPLLIEFLPRPSIEETGQTEVLCDELGPSCMDPIINFSKDQTLLAAKKEAHKVRVKSERFWLFPSGALYKKSFTSPYLKCVHPSSVEAFLYKIHEGICGSHIGAGPWPTELFHKATGGHACKLMPRNMFASVRNAKSLPTRSTSRPGNFFLSPALGPSRCGG